MKKLEQDLNTSIEFQSARIDDLKGQVEPLAKENKELKSEVQDLREQVQLHGDILNKQERFSRRNNLRIVGVPATAGEDCVGFVEDMLDNHFDMPDVVVERAHRDGKGTAGRSPHILVKFLSYRDKVDIIKQANAALKDVNYFILDDLTKRDLAEKNKWKTQVKDLYSNGTKLRFFAGRWRKNGQPYTFGNSAPVSPYNVSLN
jgi:chromosome segregation ATPase